MRKCTGVQMSCRGVQLCGCYEEMHRYADVMQGCTAVWMLYGDAQVCRCHVWMHSCVDVMRGFTSISSWKHWSWYICMMLFSPSLPRPLAPLIFLPFSFTLVPEPQREGDIEVPLVLFWGSQDTSDQQLRWRYPIFGTGFFIWQTIITGRSIMPLHTVNPIKLFYIKIWIVSLHKRNS